MEGLGSISGTPHGRKRDDHYDSGHAYINQKFGCINKTPFYEDKTNCPCKTKFLFKKARLDLDQFKSF